MSHYTIKSILLVDDDRDDIYFFSKALEEFETNIELATAGDGFEAFEKLQMSVPDVILLDLNMPRMNGMAFLKAIKKIKNLKGIPVIIYTNNVSVFDEAELLKLGAYAVFTKPDDFDKTVSTISELLQMSFIRMSA
ncbi:MAG: response regulator [Bacteroidetes bacterium]|nr:response regulator [Bacteroidota bacterium]